MAASGNNRCKLNIKKFQFLMKAMQSLMCSDRFFFSIRMISMVWRDSLTPTLGKIPAFFLLGANLDFESQGRNIYLDHMFSKSIEGVN